MPSTDTPGTTQPTAPHADPAARDELLMLSARVDLLTEEVARLRLAEEMARLRRRFLVLAIVLPLIALRLLLNGAWGWTHNHFPERHWTAFLATALAAVTVWWNAVILAGRYAAATQDWAFFRVLRRAGLFFTLAAVGLGVLLAVWVRTG